MTSPCASRRFLAVLVSWAACGLLGMALGLWILLVLKGSPGVWVPFLAGLGFLLAVGGVVVGGESAAEGEAMAPSRPITVAVTRRRDTGDVRGRHVRVDRPRGCAVRVLPPHRRFH